jgi:hypothetical protein
MVFESLVSLFPSSVKVLPLRVYLVLTHPYILHFLQHFLFKFKTLLNELLDDLILHLIDRHEDLLTRLILHSY